MCTYIPVMDLLLTHIQLACIGVVPSARKLCQLFYVGHLTQVLLVRLKGLFFMFFFKDLLVYLKGRNIEIKKERLTLFYLLLSFTNGCNSQGLARLKSGIMSFSWVFRMNAGAQVHGLSSITTSGTNKELGWKWSCWDRNQCPYAMPVPQAAT